MKASAISEFNHGAKRSCSTLSGELKVLRAA